MSHIQLILLASLASLFAHQFEEYVFPGGAPVIVNIATFGEKNDFTHYPGNTHSSMIVNNVAWIIYSLAIVFPDFLPLGIGTMLFNLFQLFGHGFQMNKALKTWYNPGLATSLFLFTPIAIYYLYYIHTNGLTTAWTWLWGVIGFIFVLASCVILPVQLLKNRNSPYAISDIQLKKYEKITALCRLK
ncbi:HXXEE domain-containing protein [Necropsobacter rosorum]|uniref:HXXEE domain-containing protein n=1 Tax=Necropsobacter rosorum TaxID=908285 RepID=UPI003C7DC514